LAERTRIPPHLRPSFPNAIAPWNNQTAHRAIARGPLAIYSSHVMSLAQIEAELEHLSPDELRRLALHSWSAFMKKGGGMGHECHEDDPALLAALDAAVTKADAAPGAGCTADEVRARLQKWTSK
jgi:hypothetical protein